MGLASSIRESEAMKNAIFYKGVTASGHSLIAPPPLRLKYEIGKRYKFSHDLPAHMVTAEDFKTISMMVCELCLALGAKRILICFGNVFTSFKPIYPFWCAWRIVKGYDARQKIVGIADELIPRILTP